MGTTIHVSFPLMILLATTSGVAHANPPFAATCQDVLTHGYRDATDLFGKPTGESWSTDEHFNSIWKFIYKGGEDIAIDDKHAYVVVEHPGVLIAIEGGTSGVASGVWSYAIHLGMERIVASQVNAFGSFADTGLKGVKARSVNLKCAFAFHTDQPPPIASNWEDIVRQAQTRLKTLGFYQGPIDGTVNPKTRDALRFFQLAEGLPMGGELDKATRKALLTE